MTFPRPLLPVHAMCCGRHCLHYMTWLCRQRRGGVERIDLISGMLLHIGPFFLLLYEWCYIYIYKDETKPLWKKKILFFLFFYWLDTLRSFHSTHGLDREKSPWDFENVFINEGQSGYIISYLITEDSLRRCDIMKLFPPQKKCVFVYLYWLVATHRFFMFTPIPGEMIQFDDHIFQIGWNHHLVYEDQT